MVGGTGSGKSELLKTLIYEAIHRNDEAIIIIDPKGDLARQTAKWVEHSLPNRRDKLVYLSFFDFNGYTPVLNPLQLPPVPPLEYEKMVDITTREIVHTLQNIFTETNNSGFTEMMVSVLAPCVEVLIRKGDADFWDLMRFMDNTQNHDLWELGKQCPNESVRRFFHYDFVGIPITTKDGIKWRVRNLLNSQVFAKFSTGASTINLKELIDQKKIIIFNLDKASMSATVSSQIGKLLVSLIQVLAMQRGGMPDKDKTPTHLFIDEFHNYITMSIKHVLAEARSNKLYLTMAQQVVGQDLPNQNFKKILMGNTNIKILGKSSTNENYKDLSDELDIPIKQLQELPEFHFYIKVANGKPFRIKGRSGLIDDKNAMSESAWQQIVAEQIKRYYIPEQQAIQQKRQEDESRMAQINNNTSSNSSNKPFGDNKKQGKNMTANKRTIHKQQSDKSIAPDEPPFPFDI